MSSPKEPRQKVESWNHRTLIFRCCFVFKTLVVNISVVLVLMFYIILLCLEKPSRPSFHYWRLDNNTIKNTSINTNWYFDKNLNTACLPTTFVVCKIWFLTSICYNSINTINSLISIVLLGKDPATKLDDFLEKIKTAFDPAPHFWIII